MDPWDHIRRACADRTSGSVGVALRAARGLERLSSKRDLARAARALARAHPAMAALLRLCAEAYEAEDPAAAVARFAAGLESGTRLAADGARWVVTRRSSVVLTHSASSSVVAALRRVRGRIARVVCTASLPGGEGRALARRLERDGFEAEVVADAAIARAAGDADLALVGGDAVTEEGVVNKVGTRLVALAARDAGIGCYAICATAKLIPARAIDLERATGYEPTPLELFDAVLTERGPKRPGWLKRAAGRVRIPKPLLPA